MPIIELQEYDTLEMNAAGAAAAIVIDGHSLTLQALHEIACRRVRVEITRESSVLDKVHASCKLVKDALRSGHVIYGVNTGFGGMADVIMDAADVDKVQANMLWTHKSGAGNFLPVNDVRAAMVLRANSHLRGGSGIRLELIERIVTFLNEDVTPCVPELGSIGASGDLVPLSYIAGCITGHDANYQVCYRGETISACEALERLNLQPIALEAKEALAMLNGTSVMTAIASLCTYEAQRLVSLALYVHSLMFQGLYATSLSFHPFIHKSKPHRGQRWAAETMAESLQESALLRNSAGGKDRNAESGLVQDRYSLRCLSQYLGPVLEGLTAIARDMQVEMNSTNDNPLIDVETGSICYGGNFLGEYVGIGMDQLRYYLGLVAKHLDVQIAMLVDSRFSNGLPSCLIGNQERRINMGLKALQIVGNSIMPLLSFLGNSLADRYPTHAEQYNQNINSQGFGSANLARQSIDLFRRYLSLSLLFAVQSVDLRTKKMHGSYDAGAFLSPKTRPLYTAVRHLTGRPADRERPWLFNDDEQELDMELARLTHDLCEQDSLLLAALPSGPGNGTPLFSQASLN